MYRSPLGWGSDMYGCKYIQHLRREGAKDTGRSILAADLPEVWMKERPSWSVEGTWNSRWELSNALARGDVEQSF